MDNDNLTISVAIALFIVILVCFYCVFIFFVSLANKLQLTGLSWWGFIIIISSIYFAIIYALTNDP